MGRGYWWGSSRYPRREHIGQVRTQGLHARPAVHSRPARIHAAIRSRDPAGSAPTSSPTAVTATAATFRPATGATAVGDAAGVAGTGSTAAGDAVAAAFRAALTATTVAVGSDIARGVGGGDRCAAGARQRKLQPSPALPSRPPNAPSEPGRGSSSGRRRGRYRRRRHARRRRSVPRPQRLPVA